MSVLEPESNKEDKPKTPRCKMVLLCILITLPCILGGMVESYSAVALPQMHLNTNQASLFGSIYGFASPIGAILFSLLVDLCGRKFAIVTGIIPFFVGWLLLFWNRNVYINILGRFINGISTGTFFYPVQVYAVECIAVNDNRLRSSFATWGITVNSFGIFLVFLLSSFSLTQQIPAIATSLSFIFLISVYLIIPESPTWLFLKGRVGDAKTSQKKLGIFQPILYETNGSRPTLDTVDGNSKSLWSNFRYGLQKLKREDIYKPLVIMTLFVILYNCTGGFALLSYMMDIIGKKPSEDSAENMPDAQILQSHKYEIISGGIVFAAHLFTSFILHRVGVKKLAIMAAVFLCIGYAAMGYMSVTSHSALNSFYANVAGVWLVTFAFHLGVYAVPTAILSDVFPSDAKCFAGFPILISNLVSGIVIELHQYLYLWLEGYLYFVYLLVGVLYALFVYYFVPETVGKTPDQIKEQF